MDHYTPVDVERGRQMYETYVELMSRTPWRKNTQIEAWDDLTGDEQIVWVAFAIEW